MVIETKPVRYYEARAEVARTKAALRMPEPPPSPRRLWQTSVFLAAMILFLVFSDWYNTNDVSIRLRDGAEFSAKVRLEIRDALEFFVLDGDGELGEVRRLPTQEIESMEPIPSPVMTIHAHKWELAAAVGLAILFMLWQWFSRAEVVEWLSATWDYAKLIVPLLFGGVFLTGFVGALIPEKTVATLVGGNSLPSNLVASFTGMIWHFATLTETPITEMLIRLGMGWGPALALLLAGPALSLPSLLVLIRVMGPKKTTVFAALVVVMSTLVGWSFGAIF